MPELASLNLADATIPVALAVGYLLGSIPFGLLLTRMAGRGDVRAIGSGNIGATNVLRTGSKKLAAATLLGDTLKGTAAVYAGWVLAGDGGALVAGLAAFFGHIFPVWLRFRGGKGVATYIGITLGLYWPAFVVFAATWLAAAAISRYSSAGALAASLTTTASFFFFGQVQIGLVFIPLTLLLWIRHADNISRLAAGTEGKIGRKA
jgi:acyl phosphate:glycerol-3-phosphate acyltransferase